MNYKNITFNIPIKIDHLDRLRNLKILIKWLDKFKPNVILYEIDSSQKLSDFKFPSYFNYKYIKNELFHRTKYLNEMALISDSDVIVNHDVDVIVNHDQFSRAVSMIGEYDMVYPYTDFIDVLRINPIDTIDTIERKTDINRFNNISYGGSIIWDKEKFIEGGMENENFISYGYEDLERYHRFRELGYNINRVNGNLYHMHHFRSSDSNATNKYFKHNKNLYEKIRKMDKAELIMELRSELPMS